MSSQAGDLIVELYLNTFHASITRLTHENLPDIQRTASSEVIDLFTRLHTRCIQKFDAPTPGSAFRPYNEFIVTTQVLMRSTPTTNHQQSLLRAMTEQAAMTEAQKDMNNILLEVQECKMRVFSEYVIAKVERTLSENTQRIQDAADQRLRQSTRELQSRGGGYSQPGVRTDPDRADTTHSNYRTDEDTTDILRRSRSDYRISIDRDRDRSPDY